MICSKRTERLDHPRQRLTHQPNMISWRSCTVSRKI